MSVLPYASEIFGVYQPMLGWRSKRTAQRIDTGFLSRQRRVVEAIVDNHKPDYSVHFTDDGCRLDVERLLPGALAARNDWTSVITARLAEGLPPAPTDEELSAAITADHLADILNGPVRELAQQMYHDACERDIRQRRTTQRARTAVEEMIARESRTAGALLRLASGNRLDAVRTILTPFRKATMEALTAALVAQNGFDTLDPKHDLDRIGLSPVGIVHLFRQYFFELDTFLGSPVGHVWVPVGATVELVEINTRRVLVERTDELLLETTRTTESTVTTQDELSEAVKQDNRDEVKFGATATANQNWVWGSASETASFDYTTTQQNAREQSHKYMRQQSEKLSTQMKQSIKTTFKTVTETTETSSKRYVLSNTSDEMLNYELRRKMRQVGVQVQDIGTYLCWQTYVDDPGEFLGIAQLMHIVASPKLSDIPPPELIVPPGPRFEDLPITIPYKGEEDENDITYRNGGEADVDFGENTDHIQWEFPQTVFSAQAGEKLANIEFDTTGVSAEVSAIAITKDPSEPTKWTYVLRLNSVNFGGRMAITFKAKLRWEPAVDQLAIDAENKKRMAAFTAANELAYRKEFVAAARERIELASGVQPRRYEDLREEERIAVYRKLIQDMLAPQALVPTPDDHTRHVVAELLNSIFDIDKMLYFVAPEWWRPRLHHSHQQFGNLVAAKDPDGNPVLGPDGRPVMVPASTTQYPQEHQLGWGGIGEVQRDDSYYITEKSVPAKLGSSLGWLLQLDGDNLRNSFLNAPWVKAVMPIRPGKERQALNWLKRVEGMNTLTENDMYTGPETDLQDKTIFEVLDILADKVADKHRASNEVNEYRDPERPLDDDSAVFATPLDRVYEHGFYPLQGGFKATVNEDFEVFDQWIEIVPTDQVAAVEVKYDPKTGRQL
ncbi:hypothetical protein A5699_16400 [Mycobacterium sp. E802]|nr:hypothetical protein A5699_16400 [Mycobacterium sp. E802]